MTKLINLMGQQFGNWTVVGDYTRVKSVTYWGCVCKCGVEKSITAYSLRSGSSTQCLSCGATTHGMAGTYKGNNTEKEYNSWHAAKSRCTNKNNSRYLDYGGRGITMCQEWLDSFEAFYLYIGKCPPNKILDRTNNELGYMPGNVRWVSYSLSNLNRRKKLKNETVP